jgi:hypothetical protein
MRNRPFISRGIAFFLLIVFSQKAGAGLLLHNIFHDNVVNNKIHIQGHKDQNRIAYHCACIDDLLMPFNSSKEVVYSIPVFAYSAPAIIFDESISFHPFIYTLLRGPPVFIA